MRIRLRGHHLFCIPVMQKWTLWGPRFWENVEKYKRIMESNPGVIIEVVRYCGDTCNYCPNNLKGKCRLYDFQENGNKIDLEILDKLGLKIGDQLSYAELKRLIKQKFETMPSICDWACGVKDTGCTEGFAKIKRDC